MAINNNSTPSVRLASVITTTGTWLAPANTSAAFVSIHGATGGGGGNGGGNRYSPARISAAGGPGIVSGSWVQIIPGQTYTVTIGAAGNGGSAGQSFPAQQQNGTDGATGGTTSFENTTVFRVTGSAGGQGGGRYVPTPAIGSVGTAAGLTALSSLSPFAGATPKTGTISTQQTGGFAGGAAAPVPVEGSRYGQNITGPGAGNAGAVYIYI